MANLNKDIRDILENLIKLNADRIEGYTRAQEDTENPELKRLFSFYSDQSHHFKAELNSEMINYGGLIPPENTFLGQIHKVWLDLKASMTSPNTGSILDSCEFGENAIIQEYDKLLTSEEVILPIELRHVIARQQQDIKVACERIHSLRQVEKIN
ncbi:hypothetical protein GCM10027275_19280 [Rhabdobacter roseus]|uniref:Uncharacterized protein (TIGR02284 family) n=1 Tax=Rhabdobacter roseus TaxID=1655419 RepID=A0A840TKC2_9BACT|nr:PA2169 family four-helix-bundle protein [Rhabdobacter roseus]MBB5283854.1 uncharacterized protein (TIGR02284 family) [Rhabdobacter roseus]